MQLERSGSSQGQGQGVDPRLYQVPPMRELEQMRDEQANVIDTRLPPPLQQQPSMREIEQKNGHAERRSPSHGREIAPDTAARSGTASPSKRGHGSISTDDAPAVPVSAADATRIADATKTPDIPPVATAVAGEKSGSRTPEKVPEATDIPHAKLAVGGGFAGVAGVADEDLRAIRVLDRKFCI